MIYSRVIKYCRIIVLLIFGISVSFTLVVGQDKVEESATSTEQLDRKTWEAFVEKADYFKPEPEEKTNNNVRRSTGEINLSFLKYIFIGIAIALIVFVLLRVFASELFQTKRNRKRGTEFTIDQLEDNIEEAPLYKWLREAIESKQYKLAIRVYYLIVLQELNEKRQILWHKDKTNYHYVREMSQQPTAMDFKNLTTIFEKVWYGPYEEIAAVDYEQIQPVFHQYINQITKK